MFDFFIFSYLLSFGKSRALNLIKWINIFKFFGYIY